MSGVMLIGSPTALRAEPMSFSPFPVITISTDSSLPITPELLDERGTFAGCSATRHTTPVGQPLT